MNRTLRTVCVLGCLGLGCLSCDSDGDAAEPVGGEGEACYPNGTCDEGFACADDVCVVAVDTCGNGACETAEDAATCPADCGSLPLCGDGICQAAERVATCPKDCQPVCGDGMVEGAEVCDATNLGSSDCVSEGYTGGLLGCASNCLSYDYGRCSEKCGDGVRQGGEVCDGGDFGGDSCLHYGFAGGSLTCAGDCSAVTQGSCLDQVCGNGIVEEPEMCDGGDLQGEACTDFAQWNGGELRCASDCSAFDTARCWHMTCGNAVIEGDEVCDGTRLNYQTCASIGFEGGGTLTCDASCLEYDTSACFASVCETEADCNACFNCALTNYCMVEYNQCNANPDCGSIMSCLSGCMGNPSCAQTCKVNNPAGVADYEGLMQCALCDTCPTLCPSFQMMFGHYCL